MPNYIRPETDLSAFFFTVVTFERKPILTHPTVRLSLHSAVQQIRARYPFRIAAWVLLPEHMHCIWDLPSHDLNYARRWSLIKAHVSKNSQIRDVKSKVTKVSRILRHESSIWQRRFWEHAIRDENDFRRHLDYIHYNPVKHKLVQNVVDWPFSSFHRYVRSGIYDSDWGSATIDDGGDFGE